jgi:dihydroxyacetone kinase-like predicted kinase
LSRGPGFDAVFQSLGATVMDLGDIVKPPVGEITRAADAMGLPDVFVLPNHKNVVLAAEQARSLCRCTLHLVSTTSLPQGVAAAMAFSPGEPLTQIREAMERATAEIVTVEVTIAAANRTADGVTVHEGDCIAFVDGRLVGAAENLTAALLAGLETASAQGASLVTIYAGSAIDGPELDGIRSLVARRFPDASVEALEGGQALYPLIASVER